MVLIATSHSASYWSATLACIIVELLSRSSRQETAASRIDDVHLFVRLSPKCKKNAIFSKTKEYRAMVSINDLYEVVHGLFKEPIIGPLQSKMAEIVIFFYRGWSDLDKISQTGTE